MKPETVDQENNKRILEKWYEALDRDYHETGDPGCEICYEAFLLGVIPEGEPKEVQI